MLPKTPTGTRIVFTVSAIAAAIVAILGVVVVITTG